MTDQRRAGTASPATIPVWAPYYGASIGVAVSRYWRKYAVFSGRASRSEYWWWYLIQYLVNGAFSVLAYALGGFGVQPGSTMAPPSGGTIAIYLIWVIWTLATIVPDLALTVRRLHDTNHSGRWIFIGLVPLVGWITVLVFVILPADRAGARFDIHA